MKKTDIAHDTNLPYFITVFCKSDTPTFLLPFVISVIMDVLHPADKS